ncbi:MAG: hypothetical protein AVDCRST_MAG89-4674, partial [uncultured Gemmatimonadetes bacterium]
GHHGAVPGRGHRAARHQQARAAGSGRVARVHPHDQRSGAPAVPRGRSRNAGLHLL